MGKRIPNPTPEWVKRQFKEARKQVSSWPKAKQKGLIYCTEEEEKKMETLKLTNKQIANVKERNKFLTIRKGILPINFGQKLTFVNAEDSSDTIDVEVTKVSHQKAKSIDWGWMLADRMSCLAHLVEEMQKYYDNFDEDTETTVIFFREW